MRCLSSINLARAAGSVSMSESGPYARARRSFSSRSASGWVEGSSISRPHCGRERSASAMSPPGKPRCPLPSGRKHERVRRGPQFGARVIGEREQGGSCARSLASGDAGSPRRFVVNRLALQVRSLAREAVKIRGRRPMRRTIHPQVQRTPATDAPHWGSARGGHPS